jgi:hypothetical protein
MAIGGIGTTVAYFLVERDVLFALLGIPTGLFGGLLVHGWVWRTIGPGDPTRKR